MLGFKDILAKLQIRRSMEAMAGRIPPKDEVERLYRAALAEGLNPLQAYTRTVRRLGKMARPLADADEQEEAGHALMHAASLVPEGYKAPHSPPSGDD